MHPHHRDEFPDLARALSGQFAIERELGRGGMGVVLLARDLMLDRPVALKLLPSALAAQPDTRERFLREARTAARLSHPHIVTVHRADDLHGVAFFAMAYVDGESLAERLRDRGSLPVAEAVRVLREVAWALAYAHARGVVHRDVKPENIMLERGSGRALVTDFGIAHLAEASRLTQDGHVLGTVHYMSPEQATGDAIDGRSDLYALGVVAYQLLSGRLPFEGLPAPAVLVAHATREAPPLDAVAPGVPPAIAAVVARCLAKRPEDRYATGEALADALGAALADAPGPDTLPPGLPPVVTEPEAEAIWRRAAQLQADALHRLESRRDLLPRGPGDGAPAAADASRSGGYRLRDVVDAASEAGISRQYVAMALAELPQGTLAPDRAAAMGVDERQATRFLGTQERSLGVSVTADGTPARLLRALGAVLQQSPYELRLRETVGGHPLDGGVLVFDLPGQVMSFTTTMSLMNTYWYGTRLQLEATQVQVTLRALPGEPARTELTMLCDLRPGVRRNVAASRILAGIVGALGAIGGGAGGMAAVAGAALPAALAVVPAAAAGTALFAGAVGGYRWLYRSTLGKARDEMRRALDAVAASVRAEQVFGAMPARAGAPVDRVATSTTA